MTTTAIEQPPTMTEAEWRALGEKLFGPEMDRWRFRCPNCSNVMSIHKARGMSLDELAKLRAGWNIEQECIGRYIDGAGCNWCAYGLFSGPHFVVRESGRRTPVFGFDTAAAAADAEHGSELAQETSPPGQVCETCKRPKATAEDLARWRREFPDPDSRAKDPPWARALCWTKPGARCGCKPIDNGQVVERR